MGTSLIIPNGPSKEVIAGVGPLGTSAGQWYRIATFGDGVNTSKSAKASADFIITTTGSGRHDVIRMFASINYDSAAYSVINLHDYSAYSAPSFQLARLVLTNGTYGGASLEVFSQQTITDVTADLEVRHIDVRGGIKWTPMNFVAVPSTPTQGIVAQQRGLYPTGDWVNLTVGNGWSNFGGGWSPLAVRMRPGSIVELRGLIKGSPNATTVTTLPLGCRPVYNRLYPSIDGANAAARIDVNANGTIIPQTGNGGFLTLDHINFVAEQ